MEPIHLNLLAHYTWFCLCSIPHLQNKPKSLLMSCSQTGTSEKPVLSSKRRGQLCEVKTNFLLILGVCVDKDDRARDTELPTKHYFIFTEALRLTGQYLTEPVKRVCSPTPQAYPAAKPSSLYTLQEILLPFIPNSVFPGLSSFPYYPSGKMVSFITG